MEPFVYYIICAFLSITVLIGIALMSKVKTAIMGNILSSVATLIAIIVTLLYFRILSDKWTIYTIFVCLFVGSIIGLILAQKVKMIQMPQLVATLNGVGGAASALVGGAAIFSANATFELATATVALFVGTLTFTGSLIAAGKLANIIDGRPVVWKGHTALMSTSISLLLFILITFLFFNPPMLLTTIVAIFISAFLGIGIAIRVGGADMPITISLLNSFSGVAAAIAGLAINDILLVSIGGIVGSSGLLLTQIMCKSMNSSLSKILQGKTSVSKGVHNKEKKSEDVGHVNEKSKDVPVEEILRSAKKAIIVPGYGMAIAQAQHLVKQLSDILEDNGCEVKYAIHPVAGRMPGHMNVLLAEADVSYEQLYEMEDINDEFKDCDVCIVVGANDVLNPAAREAEGTPIYGMPILNVDEAKHIVFCNSSLSPGYAGVENPLYKRTEGISILLGDASETLANIIKDIKTNKQEKEDVKTMDSSVVELLSGAKKAIIVPGYGMAIAQAQHLVKQLADILEGNGCEVKYAIHPVAGRMPGHMNVLLAEADVSYEQLYEMEDINEEFKDCDVCIVVGANDVLNPAAREAEGTPIYGMPILNVDEAKHIIFCNSSLSPGYAGVENPLYKRTDGISILLGDASETLANIIKDIKTNKQEIEVKPTDSSVVELLSGAKKAIIVPGYGMAIAQAQHLVKQLADILEGNGCEVKYAIHPVAGRMPGHMNVLLAEADVSYEQLYEMEDINEEFKDCDVCIVVGANDVLNPAAREAEGTPIYGMPILNVDEAKHIIFCNSSLSPGYAGVENPLYKRTEGISLLLGDASETLEKLLEEIKAT